MNRLRFLLPVITVFMIAFIWVHSMMPGDASASESGFLLSLVDGVFGEGIITEHIIRKTAHFTEYMLLGIICCADFAAYGKGGFGYALVSLYICLFTAVVDESIQLFVVGRSGMLFDVWLDHIGSITGTAVLNIILALKRSLLKGLSH